MKRDDIRNVQTLPNGQMGVEGEKYPFIQIGAIHTIHFEVNSLSFVDGYGGLGSDIVFASRAEGVALAENDKFKIAGDPERRSKELKLGIATSNERKWEASLGFYKADWEIGDEDTWFLELYLPTEAFATLREAHFAGNANRLRISIGEHNLWTEDVNRYATPRDSISWYFLPGSNGSISLPEMGKGKITNLSWTRDSHKQETQEPFEYEEDRRLKDQEFSDQTLPPNPHGPADYALPLLPYLKAAVAALIVIALAALFK